MDRRSPGVLILYNKPDPSPPQEDRPSPTAIESEQGVLKEVQAVRQALRDSPCPVRAFGVRSLRDLPPLLARAPERIVINLVESLTDSPTAFNFVPALCDAFGKSCTGGDSDALSLTLDKALTKSRLQAVGLRVPPALYLPAGVSEIPASGLPPFPILVKPATAAGSEGVDAHRSLARSPSELRRALRFARSQTHGPLLLERFIAGREFNISLIEQEGRIIPLPVSEVDFSLFPPDRPPIVDYAVKWRPGTIPGHISPRRCPARIPDSLASRLQKTAVQAWRACGCRDYVRVDMRMDRQGRLYILDVNQNPDLSPLAGLPAALRAAHIPFTSFVLGLIENARRRLVESARRRAPHGA